MSSSFPLTSGATTVAQAPDWFAQRLARQFPINWAGSTALAPGANLYALLRAKGSGFSLILLALAYAISASRIQTATSPELDLAAVDFGLSPRQLNESDATYSAYIIANIFKPLVTRAVVTAAAQATTPAGTALRVIEPFFIPDVGAVGYKYVGYDSPSIPGRVGGPAPWFGIVEASTIGQDQISVVALANAINAVRAYGTTVWVADTSG